MHKILQKNFIAWCLVILGAVGIITSIVLILHKPVLPKTIVKTPTGVSVATPVAIVETSPPTQQEVKTYSVAVDLPKYIDIPAIGVKQARILHLGLLSNGQIATPTNTADTGWYRQSSKPGVEGAMFIYGHVSSTENNGVFHSLKKLKPGDEIYITRGDNTTYDYVVKSSKSYPADSIDMNNVLSPVNSSIPGLNLMTCDGKFVKETQTFTNRLVVFTSLLRS